MWIATSTAPNILRPATAILRKVFMSTLPASSAQSADRGRFGFGDLSARIEQVGADIQGESHAENVWKVVVKRLEGTGDLELVAQR